MTSELRECLTLAVYCTAGAVAAAGVLRVAYDMLGSFFDGTSATVGAQGSGRRMVLPISFNAPCDLLGRMFVYRFGAGTDPTRADTDGDGLDNYGEYLNETDPSGVDTDGDGVPDGYDSDGVGDGTQVKNVDPR